MKHLVIIGLILLLTSCSRTGWLERLEARYGPGTSIDALQAELQAKGFGAGIKTDFLMIQGGYITRNGRTFYAHNIDEYLDIYCDTPSCSYLSAGKKDRYFGWLLTRRYFVYAAQENGKITAIDTVSEPWRWLDIK